MKYYLTQAGVKFIQEGVVKARNKAKKKKWVKRIGREDTRGESYDPSYRAMISTRKGSRHGQPTGMATVVAGRERLGRKK